jgi:hypothetical protein
MIVDLQNRSTEMRSFAWKSSRHAPRPKQPRLTEEESARNARVWERVWYDGLACGLSDEEATKRANAACRILREVG